MSKITTVLFDFDGVIVDTEPLYDVFWSGIAEKYGIEIPDFSAKIKGTTLQRIFDLYFSGYSSAEHAAITRACEEYEKHMNFPEVKGAVEFIHNLRSGGYRLGLVTSSMEVKMKGALKQMKLEHVFDTLVTADRITRGKPDPMCYLLAAADLQVSPDECVVFEDSFPGIRSAAAAGMRVIGLSTTNSAEAIREKVSAVIPDFSQPEKILPLLSRN